MKIKQNAKQQKHQQRRMYKCCGHKAANRGAVSAMVAKAVRIDIGFGSSWRIQEKWRGSNTGSKWSSRNGRHSDHTEQLGPSGNHGQDNHAEAQSSSGRHNHTRQQSEQQEAAEQTESSWLERRLGRQSKQVFPSTRQPHEDPAHLREYRRGRGMIGLSLMEEEQHTKCDEQDE